MEDQILTLDELKTLQLGILTDVDSFCRSQNLRYSLAYGTLLGAVRHKGFIPWDDDIDIWMLREDYEKFRRIYKSDRYYLVDSSSHVELPYGKVCDNETILIENANHSFSPGVFIDIFPVDFLPIDEKERKKVKKNIRRLYQVKTLKEIKVNITRCLYKNLLLVSLKVLTSPIAYDRILYMLTDTMRMPHFQNAMCLTDYNDFTKDICFPTDAFNNLIDIQFEDREFKSVACYDAVLTSAYGNYMELPPFEKRVTHHSYIAKLK